MTLELYYHPLASYCWKALIALYEAEVPFEKRFVDLSDPKQRSAFLELTPLGSFRCSARSSRVAVSWSRAS
jgi:glutathione S-transferase